MFEETEKKIRMTNRVENECSIGIARLDYRDIDPNMCAHLFVYRMRLRAHTRVCVCVFIKPHDDITHFSLAHIRTRSASLRFDSFHLLLFV